MLATLILTTVLITPIGTWQAEPPRLLTIESLTTYLANRQVVEEPIVLPVQHRYRNAVGVERWRSLVEKYFAPRDVGKALCIIGRESGGNPNAKNVRSSAAGMWQFLRSTWDWVAESTGSPSYADGGPYDPVWATVNALWLVEHGGGWGHWVTNMSC